MQNMINFNIRRLSYKNNFFSEKSKEYLMFEDNKNYNLIIIIFSEKIKMMKNFIKIINLIIVKNT